MTLECLAYLTSIWKDALFLFLPSTYCQKMCLLKEHCRCQVKQGISFYTHTSSSNCTYTTHTHTYHTLPENKTLNINEELLQAKKWPGEDLTDLLKCWLVTHAILSRTACKMLLSTKPMHSCTLIAKGEDKNICIFQNTVSAMPYSNYSCCNLLGQYKTYRFIGFMVCFSFTAFHMAVLDTIRLLAYWNEQASACGTQTLQTLTEGRNE